MGNSDNCHGTSCKSFGCNGSCPRRISSATLALLKEPVGRGNHTERHRERSSALAFEAYCLGASRSAPCQHPPRRDRRARCTKDRRCRSGEAQIACSERRECTAWPQHLSTELRRHFPRWGDVHASCRSPTC